MADDLSSYAIFWTKDEQQNDIQINRRSPVKMQSYHLNEKKTKIRHHQIPENRMSTCTSKQKKSKQDEKSPEVKDKPSLKDLRPEDKKRVANLVRELAKTGEEKEVAVEQLQVERLKFEHRKYELLQQMTVITQERETVQNQYLECQKLLAEYQKQLAEEQDKMSTMNHQLLLPPKIHHSRQTSQGQRIPQQRNAEPSNLQQSGTSPAHQPTAHRANQPIARPANQPIAYPANQHIAHPAYQPTAHPYSLQTDTHDHQPSLNGYPPPSQPYFVRKGYQPPHFNRKLNQYEEQFEVPSTYQQQNGVLYSTRQTRQNSVHSGMDINVPNDDTDFQPVLSSTHGPSVQRQSGKFRHKGGEPVTSLYLDTVPEPPEKLSMSHPVPSISPEFHLSGYSRTNSCEFQPLLPENDSESSTSPDYDKNEFGSLPFDPQPISTEHGCNHPIYSHNLQHVPPQSFHNMLPQQRQEELLKQRLQLEQEQAWLHQKLAEQEALLALKQAQLTQTELLYLQTGDQSYPYNAAEANHNTITYRMPNKDSQTATHTMPNVDPPPVRRKVHGLFLGSGTFPITTNCSPNEFDELGQDRVVEKYMHGLGHTVKTSYSSHQARSNQLNTSSSSSSSRHRNRGQLCDQGKNLQRTRSSELKASGRTNDGSAVNGDALHSISQSRRIHRGSVCSSPSTTSTSTTSSNTRRKEKHASTSSLHRDAESGTSPHLSVSPGKMQVTLAPRHNAFNRSSSKIPKDSRQQGNLPLQINRQHTSLSTTPTRNTLQLTDLIDSLDASSITRTKGNSQSRTQNSSRGRPSESGVTSELFSLVESDTEVEQQESRMLEEVFFVVC